MVDDLSKLFGELAAKVPVEPDGTFDFSSELLPVSPEHMAIDKLVIQKSRYRYGGYYQVDLLWFHADPEIYRLLALLILSKMFHAEPKLIQLDLAHPASDIKHLMLEYSYETFEAGGLYVQPFRMSYTAGPLDFKMGWGLPELDRIRFRLTNLQDEVHTEGEYQARDAVWLDGNERSYAWLAWYLLDIGRPEEKQGMYRLEGSGQEGGDVGGWSAEARLILPGHIYWREEIWEANPQSNSPEGA